MTLNQKSVAEHLRALQIPFEFFRHDPAFTMADCLALPFASPDVTFCKNILLCNRQQTCFYLYVTLPDKTFRTADVSKALGVSRLSFAPEEALMSRLHTASGSLSPLGLWFDAERAVTLVVDREVRRPGRIAFHPCDNTATVVFDQQIFFDRVVPALTSSPVFL